MNQAELQQNPGRFGRLAAWVLDHPLQVLLTFAVLVFVSAGLALTQLDVDPNMLKLLPKDEPVTQALAKLDAEEGGQNLLTVAVRGDDPAALDAYMIELRDALSALEDVEFALYDLDADLAWDVGLRQLPLEDLEQLRLRLRSALAMGPAAQNPLIAARLLDLGPLTEKLQNPGQTAALASSEGIARVLVRPTGSANDTAFGRKLMADVDGVLQTLDAEAQGLQVVWVGGPYRHNVEDVEGIIYDLRWTALASLVLVLSALAVAFRSPRVLVLVFVPLLVGNALTFGYAAVAVGKLTTFTSFFSAVLIGLGIDFSIHLYARVRELRVEGFDNRGSIIAAWDRVGPPCLTAAVTSAGGFCALWVAGFEGFQQLGTILAGGVLLCLASVLCLLPLLISRFDGASQPLNRGGRFLPQTLLSYKAAPGVLAVLVVLTLGSVVMLRNVGFQYDLSELRRTGMAYADLDAEERALAQDSYTPVVVSYPSDAALAADHQRLTSLVQAGQLPEVGRVLSVHSVVPVDQGAHLEKLRELQTLAQSPNATFLPQQAQDNLKRLARASLEPLTVGALPEAVRAVLGSSNDHHRLLVVPAGNMWDLRETVALTAALEEALPGREAAGTHLAMAVLYRLVQGDAPRVAAVALFVVFLCTLIDLRSPLRALGAVAALAAGMAWAGAAFGVFGVKISLMNFVGIPILMGIGVDVIIHLLHRIHEEGPGGIREAIRTTGWASSVSSLTTILSFAALSFASSEGVQSLGLLIVVGLTTVTLSALVTVPVGWMTAWHLGSASRTQQERQAS